MDKSYKEIYYGTDEELESLKDFYQYPLIRFQDRVVEFPNVYRHEEIGQGLTAHERYEGHIFRDGTPLNANTLGEMDLGIYLLYLQFEDMKALMQQIMIEVSALKGAALNNMPNNQFFIDFKNLEGIKIVEGWYDEKNAKVVNN